MQAINERNILAINVLMEIDSSNLVI